MQEFLFEYHGVSPTTWVYLSSLLMIGLFFKFSRFWSVRNLDLVMLILLAPGLLLIHFGNHRQSQGDAVVPTPAGQVPAAGSLAAASEDAPSASSVSVTVAPAAASTGEANGAVPAERADATRGRRLELIGYWWLLGLSALWLVRLLLDPAMIRRPLLTPNLSVGGLTFIGIFLFVFLMANVVARQPVGPSGTPSSPGTTADHPLARGNAPRMDVVMAYQQEYGPGYAVLNSLPSGARKTIAILSHLAVVIGLVLVGYRHFDNLTNGIGAAMLYLMLPYTAQMTGRVDHVLPAAFLTWAVLCYRRPLLAGSLMGAASGCVYYPLFALPVWISFYWTRGVIRFLSGVAIALVLMSLGLVFTSQSAGILPDLQRMFGVMRPASEGLEGIWNEGIGGFDPSFRIPVLAAFVVLSLGLALWPARKNLGTVICYTAAVMVTAQFWHGYGGGLYMAWYLPMVLLTIFRPNLEDRIAKAVIVDGWLSRRPAASQTRSLAA